MVRPMEILHEWDLQIDVDGVLRGQGADPAVLRSRSPRLVACAEQALQEGLQFLEPAVAYRRLRVEALQHEKLRLEDGQCLAGPLIAQHLGPAQEVVVLICTVGDALEAHAQQVIASNAVLGLALDGVGSAAAEALATEACLLLEEEAAQRGMEATIPLSPGMIGWPVEVGQPQLFGLIDAAQVGVTLTSYSMMTPRKSLSMVLGLGEGVNQGGRTCDYCYMKETCRYQDHYEPSIA
jgi:hypothetical protein